jgi:hypothetical protein
MPSKVVPGPQLFSLSMLSGRHNVLSYFAMPSLPDGLNTLKL